MEKEKSFIIDAKRANSLYKIHKEKIKGFAEQKARDQLLIIYENIEDAALHGKNNISQSVLLQEETAEFNYVCKNFIIKELRKNGFVISDSYPYSNITISWERVKNNGK